MFINLSSTCSRGLFWSLFNRRLCIQEGDLISSQELASECTEPCPQSDFHQTENNWARGLSQQGLEWWRASLCRIPKALCPASLPTGDLRKIFVGVQVPGTPPPLSPFSTQGTRVLSVYTYLQRNQVKMQRTHRKHTDTSVADLIMGNNVEDLKLLNEISPIASNSSVCYFLFRHRNYSLRALRKLYLTLI